MAYTLTAGIILPDNLTGLTLAAQLVDTTGADVGAPIAAGFSEIGGGQYQFAHAAYPDGFRGGVKVSRTDTADVLCFIPINPEEGEQVGIIRTILAGITSLAAWLRAMARMDAPDATAIAELNAAGGTYAAATDSLEAIGAGAGGGLTAAEVWANPERTLTMSAVQVVAALTGSTIGCLRGDTLSVSITGLGDLTGRDKLWFTVKHSLEDGDPAAVIQIEETAGLLRLVGAAATPGDGSLTVDDATAGDVTIAVAAPATAQLVPGCAYAYDVQMLDGSEVRTLTQAAFHVVADVTRSVT